MCLFKFKFAFFDVLGIAEFNSVKVLSSLEIVPSYQLGKELAGMRLMLYAVDRY